MLTKITNPVLENYIPSIESFYTCSCENRGINKDDIERRAKIRDFFESKLTYNLSAVSLFALPSAYQIPMNSQLLALPDVCFLIELVENNQCMTSQRVSKLI